jgi:hypothetical protein
MSVLPLRANHPARRPEIQGDTACKKTCSDYKNSEIKLENDTDAQRKPCE